MLSSSIQGVAIVSGKNLFHNGWRVARVGLAIVCHDQSFDLLIVLALSSETIDKRPAKSVETMVMIDEGHSSEAGSLPHCANQTNDHLRKRRYFQFNAVMVSSSIFKGIKLTKFVRIAAENCWMIKVT